MRIVALTLGMSLLLLTRGRVEEQESPKLAKFPAELATVTIIPARNSFKLREPVAVTVLLEAGKEGVYVAKTWGPAGGAIPGFYVWMETLDGKRVQACEPIVDGIPNEEPDPRTILERNFVFLGQGQVIGWSTTIPCAPRKRGKYLIQARYSPDRPLSQRVASLSEVRGRVVQNILDAKPVGIMIR